MHKGMKAANVKFDFVALWVQIWGAPFDISSPKVASEIGCHLGEVVEEEKRRNLETQNLFMLVKVVVPLSKPLRWGGFIRGSDGQQSWVDYRYERLPLFCHYCGLLGYDLKHCVEYFARSSNGEEVVCQYGEWLKSIGGRSRSPPRKSSTASSQTLNAKGSDAQGVIYSSETPMSENGSTKGNLTEKDIHALGKNIKTGISTGQLWKA